MHGVGKVVDVGQAVSGRVEFGARQGLEVDVIEPDVADVAGLLAVLAAPAVDQVDQGIADPLDGGDVQFPRARLLRVTPGTQAGRPFVGSFCVMHPEGNRADARAVEARKALRERVRLGVQDEVDFPLAVERHVLVPMPCNRGKPQPLEHGAHGLRVRRRVFDELEPFGTHRVVPQVGHGRLLIAAGSADITPPQSSFTLCTTGRQ